MALFKKRHVQIKFVKDDGSDTPEATPFEIPEEAISRVMRDSVNRIAVGVIAVIGATVIMTTAGKIAVNSVDNHQKKSNN